MARRDDAPRDLLFGLLALQNGLVSRDQLVAAFGAWTGSPGRPLAELLVAQRALDPAGRDLLFALADRHLAAHGNDPERSLAALDLNRSTLENLTRIGGPDVEATLSRVGSGSADGGPERTGTYHAGDAAADGRRFRVLRPHARGGVGAVFVALDGELNREVALKQILDHHADDPVSRQRFLVEAEITGGLEHPGIVPVYGLGAYADGRPYYAMRFIRGDSLKEAIERFHEGRARAPAERAPRTSRTADPTSMELRRLLRRFTDVCNAIEYAHSRGVLHRDLKPGNVILGRHGETLVVEWGLAKPTGKAEPGHEPGERTLVPSSASGSAETLPGAALGTPAYMSPEQAAGDLDALGPRSDVYSLGATLYCLLTGRAPFDGDVGDVLRKVQRGEFPPPRRLDPSIDKALEAVCLKAMATKPEDRYASCRALADDVERWTAGEPVSAWKEPWVVRARRWVSRNRTPVAAGVAGLLVAVAGLAVVLVLQSQANARLADSLAQEAAARERESVARTKAEARFDLANNAISALYTGVTQDELLQRDEFKGLRNTLLLTAKDFFEKFFKEAADDPNLGPTRLKSVATAARKVAQVQQMTGAYADAEATYRQAIAFYEKTSPGSRIPSEMAQWHQHIADTLSAGGRPAEAYREMELAVRLAGEPGPENPPAANRYASFAQLYMGRLQWRLGRAEDARKSLEKSLPYAEKRAEAEGSFNQGAWIDLVGSYTALGNVARGSGRLSEALAWHEKALATWERLLKLPTSVEAVGYPLESLRDEAVGAVGRDLADSGLVDQARPKLEVAVRRLEAIYAKRQGDPGARRMLVTAQANLAGFLARNGDPAEAARHAGRVEELLTGFEPMVPDDHYTLAAVASVRLLLVGRGRPEASPTPDERAERDRLTTRSVAALNDAFAAGFRCAPALRSDPVFEPIRSVPAFQEILRRVEASADEPAAQGR